MSIKTSNIRNRVCGIVIKDQKIALVQLHSPLKDELIWTTPGGGVLQGESLSDCAEREVKEECLIKVKSNKLMYVSELISRKWHVIEHYFLCTYESGNLKLGKDPEKASPILQKAKWIELESLSKLPNLYPLFLRSDLTKDIVSHDSILRFYDMNRSIDFKLD